MFTPAALMWPHAVAIYRYRPGQDPDAGAVADETSLVALAAPASVQPLDVASEAVNRRVRQTTTYDVYLSADYSLAVKDLLVWVDATGKSHSLFVAGQLPQAGLPVAWKVRAVEVA